MSNQKSRIVAMLAAAVAGIALSFNAFAQTPETIDKGTLTIAFSGDMPGTGFQDGKMMGYDGEILQRIAETLKLKVHPAADGVVRNDRVGAVQAHRHHGRHHGLDRAAFQDHGCSATRSTTSKTASRRSTRTTGAT
jgi:hypothetical protein